MKIFTRLYVFCVLVACLFSGVLLGQPATTPDVNKSWTGFHYGIHIGHLRGTTIEDSPYVDTDPDGTFWGVMAGYDLQVSKRFVIGIEADWSWISAADVHYDYVGALNPAQIGENVLHRFERLSTIRVRLGFIVSHNLMAYVTGGPAWGRLAGIIQLGVVNGNNLGVLTGLDNINGATFGAGVEYMLRPNWFTRLAYIYFDSKDKTYSAEGSTVTAGFEAHTVSIGLSYKF